jgi:hypothetical protein
MPRRCRGMNSYPTDAELLARSVAEPAMFGNLYERHSLAVRRYVVRRIGDAAGDANCPPSSGTRCCSSFGVS